MVDTFGMYLTFFPSKQKIFWAGVWKQISSEESDSLVGPGRIRREEETIKKRGLPVSKKQEPKRKMKKVFLGMFVAGMSLYLYNVVVGVLKVRGFTITFLPLFPSVTYEFLALCIAVFGGTYYAMLQTGESCNNRKRNGQEDTNNIGG